MGTIAITGSASGIGAATRERLEQQGHRVLGVDMREAEVACDLGTTGGRADAVDRITAECDGRLDGLVTCAGIPGVPARQGSALVSVNYFGTVALLRGLRPALAAAERPAVVCLSSNSATCQPNWPVPIAEACFDDDEQRARALADEHGAVAAYPATKAAIAWYVRSHAPTAEWTGAGIRLNAVAPGHIETSMTAEVRRDPALGEALEAFPTPRGTPGRPAEVAALIDFLLGAEAALLCGSILYADGGTDASLRPKDWPSVWSL